MKLKYIEAMAHYNPVGQPTCSSNFRDKDSICEFLMSKKMGQEHFCLFDPDQTTLATTKPDGEGYLIPCVKCKLHNMISC